MQVNFYLAIAFSMPGIITQYFRLLLLICRRGRLRHSDHDFNSERTAALKKLQVFVPEDFHSVAVRFNSTPFIRNKTFQNLRSFAAVWKHGIRLRGRHLTSQALKLSYVRLPKSASTALSHMMLESIYQDLKNRTLTAAEVNFLTDANLETEVPSSPGVFFTVVRNPFARIVSVYRDFFENASQNFLYEDYLFGILKRHFTFKEFLQHILIIPDSLRDQHLKTQAGLVDFYRRNKIDLVFFKLEQPEEISSFLSVYKLNLPSLNRSCESYDYRSYYNDELIMLVSEIYGRDIAVFHYESEPEQLLAFFRSSISSAEISDRSPLRP